jgi:hypothetical protein
MVTNVQTTSVEKIEGNKIFMAHNGCDLSYLIAPVPIIELHCEFFTCTCSHETPLSTWSKGIYPVDFKGLTSLQHTITVPNLIEGIRKSLKD